MDDPTLEHLLTDQSAPSKTYAQLLAEGVQHAGGLAQLAAAEEAGLLFGRTLH
jgi:hypothetical protein